MPTRLDTILAATRSTLEAARASVPLAELERRAALHQPRGWAAALRRHASAGPAIIAEIKKASPSRGLIRADFDVEWIARRYEAGGAAALSVLTDEPFFQGSLRNLELASRAVRLPCLRKDFTLDEYQIVEARAYRADAVLLIAAALKPEEIKRLAAAARALDLDVLVEVHSRDELQIVLDTLGESGVERHRRQQSRPANVRSGHGTLAGTRCVNPGRRSPRGRKRHLKPCGHRPAALGRV